MNKHPIFLTLGAVTIVATACATTGTGSAQSGSATGPNSNVITTEEVDASNLRDAYDLVQHLRPTWISRGTATTVNMGRSGGRGGIIVYLDDSKQGGLEALHDIPRAQIGSIQWLDAATATAVLPGLGSDIITGAIVVHHRSGT